MPISRSLAARRDQKSPPFETPMSARTESRKRLRRIEPLDELRVEKTGPAEARLRSAGVMLDELVSQHDLDAFVSQIRIFSSEERGQDLVVVLDNAEILRLRGG